VSTKRARELRAALTPQEGRLWLYLRPLRARGFHFRRQAPVEGFYLDFVCFARRLVVDGGHHADGAQAAHDASRDAILQRHGFRTLRIWNSEINTNIDGVMRTIEEALIGPDGFTAILPPLYGEGRPKAGVGKCDAPPMPGMNPTSPPVPLRGPPSP